MTFLIKGKKPQTACKLCGEVGLEYERHERGERSGGFVGKNRVLVVEQMKTRLFLESRVSEPAKRNRVSKAETRFSEKSVVKRARRALA